MYLLAGVIIVLLVLIVFLLLRRRHDEKYYSSPGVEKNAPTDAKCDRLQAPQPQSVSERPYNNAQHITNHMANNFYTLTYSGQYPNRPMNVPVPANALKETSERYNAQFTRVSQPPPLALERPVAPRNISFVGSADSFSPAPEVRTQWEKVGLLTSVRHEKDAIMNLFRRPIAPLQDLWEYNAQDKNGFVIKLKQTNFLEDGDVVQHVIGKEGPWRVHIFSDNKWVWV
jgi:hypothetical protein